MSAVLTNIYATTPQLSYAWTLADFWSCKVVLAVLDTVPADSADSLAKSLNAIVKGYIRFTTIRRSVSGLLIKTWHYRHRHEDVLAGIYLYSLTPGAKCICRSSSSLQNMREAIVGAKER